MAAASASTKRAPAPVDAASLLQKALSRARHRCTSETEYSHENLAEWLRGALPPGWIVEVPQVAAVATSSFPAGSGPGGLPSAPELAALAAFLGVAPAAAATALSGRCETVAVALAARVAAGVAAGEEAPLEAGYAALAGALRGAPWGEQVALLFAAERAAREDCELAGGAGYVGRTRAMWRALAHDGVMAGAPALRDWTAGCPGVAERLRAVARAVQAGAAAAAGGASGGTGASALPPAQTAAALAVVPLYVLSYVWDTNELTGYEMTLELETAQYFCHVAGLVLDGARRCAIVCDPNASLVPGGPTEFLRLPFSTRHGQFAVSTSVSRYELDQRKAAKRAKYMAPRSWQAAGGKAPQKTGRPLKGRGAAAARRGGGAAPEDGAEDSEEGWDEERGEGAGGSGGARGSGDGGSGGGGSCGSGSGTGGDAQSQSAAQGDGDFTEGGKEALEAEGGAANALLSLLFQKEELQRA